MSNKKERKPQTIADKDVVNEVEKNSMEEETLEKDAAREDASGNKATEEVLTKATAEDPTSKEAEEELNTKYLRLVADFQNHKRRVEKERNEIYAYANEKIVTEILNVLDNFERALDHTPDEEGKFHEGMAMILEQLKSVLNKSGVEEIDAMDCEFDPNFHNAVMMEEAEGKESNRVVQVLQKGYKLNGKVVRATMVKVSK